MKTLIKVIVSIILLAVAIYLLDWENLKNVLLRVSPTIFFLGILTAFSTIIILGIRWHLLLIKIGSFKLLESTKDYLYATFLNSFSPANVGGDIYRFFTLKDKTSEKLTVVATLLKERILGVLAYFIGYLCFIFGLWLTVPKLLLSRKILFYPAGIILFAMPLMLVFPLGIRTICKTRWARNHNRLYNGITRLYNAIHFESLMTLAKLLGLSLIALFLWILTAQIMAFDLRIDIPYLLLGAVVILVELIRLIPITIQGVGLREGMYAYLFQIIGKSPEDGFVLGSVTYLALSLSLLFSGLIGSILKTNPFSDIHTPKDG